MHSVLDFSAETVVETVGRKLVEFVHGVFSRKRVRSEARVVLDLMFDRFPIF
jgi:hypothetical protein